MPYNTTSYQTDVPGELWTEFRQQHDDRDRINSRIVELIAMDVKRQSDGLDPGVRADINRILGGDSDGA